MARARTLNHRHWPSWLENLSLIRRLFVSRKLYLSRTKFCHYAQFGEDISINRIFPDQTTGFFVDVGCFHPKKYNNTYRLYRRGWRGINIDVDAIKIEAFDIARPKDINITTAVGSYTGTIEYYSDGIYSLTTTLSKEFASTRSGYRQRECRIDTLDNILENSPFRHRPIDFLTVDVEGYDLEVLRSLTFAIYEPRLIAIETQERLFPKIAASQLYQFLLRKHYCLVGWCGLTLLFASRMLQREMDALSHSPPEDRPRQEESYHD